MQFQVNDETYFLSLAEDERRWCFAVNTPNGARVLPVYVDAPEMDSIVVVDESVDRERAPN